MRTYAAAGACTRSRACARACQHRSRGRVPLAIPVAHAIHRRRRAQAMRGAAQLLDMWRPTADQSERCAKIHYDELYVDKDEGAVSRAVANVLLNAACNPRLLPASELVTS